LPLVIDPDCAIGQTAQSPTTKITKSPNRQLAKSPSPPHQAVMREKPRINCVADNHASDQPRRGLHRVLPTHFVGRRRNARPGWLACHHRIKILPIQHTGEGFGEHEAPAP
jgi:hypothetical protein